MKKQYHLLSAPYLGIFEITSDDPLNDSTTLLSFDDFMDSLGVAQKCLYSRTICDIEQLSDLCDNYIVHLL